MSLPGPLLNPLASPRKHRRKHRTAFLAFASIFAFSCYLLFIAYPSLTLSAPLLVHHDPAHVPAPLQKLTHHLQPIPAPRPPLALSPTEELAALAAFIAALPHNVLPPFVDPATPLDPQLVLDFDPRSDSARDELDRLVDQIWSRFPVILFTKLHSSDSREVRTILSSMHLEPPPLVVEVDQREDAHVLLPILARLTRIPGFPFLLVGGQAVGADTPDIKGLMADIRRSNENGDLTRMIFKAGAKIQSEKKKGKKNKQRRN